MSSSPYTYVAHQEALDALTSQLTRVPRVPFDTEANSLHSYHERVCLIQISLEDTHYIVDPLADMDFTDFVETLCGCDLVVHGADYDLRLMRSTFGFEARGSVFDTVLAAQLLGFERFGYAALVEHFFDVALSKSGQKSNWARRPLSESQLEYAIDDTRYLGPLADLLEDQLEAKGRAAWHREWCEKIVHSASTPSDKDPDETWRIRGSGTLGRKQLAYVREIWRWREKQAERADVPPFKILGNQQLIELAVWAAEHPNGDVEKRGPRLPRHCEGRRLQALKGALKRASGLPKDKWPERRRRREKSAVGPECKPQIEALRNECRKVAEELEVPPSVLAPKAMLVSIARTNAITQAEMQACSGMMNWQVELLEEPIRETLAKF